MWLDISAFYYRLRHAIVRRVNDAGEEFFLNSGGTEQPGIESQLVIECIPQRTSGFIRQLQLRNGYTFNYFTFSNYQSRVTDYSGNLLTGVPKNVSVSTVSVFVPGHFSLIVQHNYTSSLPLNDANSEYAEAYHLVQAKITWTCLVSKKLSFELYAGADNLLDARYSLGNDLNAAGGRYYNAAPFRNYFAGINFLFR